MNAEVCRRLSCQRITTALLSVTVGAWPLHIHSPPQEVQHKDGLYNEDNIKKLERVTKPEEQSRRSRNPGQRIVLPRVKEEGEG